jgi:DNA helicase-2/ATP-dependent DNA helicase PcrA
MSDIFDLTDEPEPPSRPAPAGGPPPYLEGLNEVQREAVEAIDGPVLVLAGAGTGKTRVLTTRLGHILWQRRAWPSQILAVTFTNKAAREMRERLSALVGEAVEGLWLGTFHALCVRILRRHAELLGLKSNFTILDSDDQVRLLKQVMQAAEIDEKRWPARVMMGSIQRWKDRGLLPDKVPGADVPEFANGKGMELYAAYQGRLQTLNACDFGDLLMHCITLFTENPDVLAEYQRRFRYILVDEYQDTNVCQYLWLRLLAQGTHNICCVGDDDQSIYSWRGAEVGNILRFEKDFPGAKIIRLEQNYRSTQTILSAASGLIAHNDGRLGKTLWTAGEAGDLITLRGLWDGEAEARFVADEIEAQQRAGTSLDQIAILVRAGFQTREFEERFITLGIPYRVIGGPRFYERMEIRDALAYLRVIAQPADDLAFERIVNKPRRGLGDTTLRAVHMLSRGMGIPMTDAARRLTESDELRPAARRSLSGLLEDFDRWRSLVETMPHDELTATMLDESGYTEMWQNDKSPDAPGRLENLKELVNAMDEFENLAGFLEHISLVMEGTEGSDGPMVNVMTLHGAKGLEFETVFLPGWEEGLFPHQRALDEGGISALEEERRLAYVGLTRAKKKAIVSFVANRRIHNLWQSSIPSRFVDELPADHVERESEPGIYGGGQGGGMAEEGIATYAARPGPQLGAWRSRSASGPRRATAPFIEGKAREIETSAAAAARFQVGTRIFHQKFGYGRIKTVEGTRLEIDFEKAGIKKVIDSFVEKV